VAVPGAHADGHDHAAGAVGAGAVAVVVERPLGAGGGVVQLVVDRSQLALAVVAAWWYDDPGRRLGVIGVTGTDGKTTTAAMAVAALEAAGVRTGLVSTAEQKIGPLRAGTPAHVTTPEAPELQRALRAMVLAGDAAAVIESTSHGLALERVGEIPFDVAILTNLTHEHLEFHGTFEAYRDSKRSLFARLAAAAGGPSKPASLPGGRPWPRGGIVNLDDPSADVFVAATHEAGATLLTYGTDAGADVRATAVGETAGGIRAEVATPRWRSSPSASSRGSITRRSAAGSPASGASGAGWSASTAGSRSSSWWTTPIPRPRWRPRSTPSPRSWDRVAG
jgi:UDP-N-acetylmuramoyl-L-alanyl-D-glutamate--2,6-diaminopimelate ligase